MTMEPRELSTRDIRTKLADVVNDAIAGKTTYITQHGRRVAAVVPLAVAEATIPPEPVSHARNPIANDGTTT